MSSARTEPLLVLGEQMRFAAGRAAGPRGGDTSPSAGETLVRLQPGGKAVSWAVQKHLWATLATEKISSKT